MGEKVRARCDQNEPRPRSDGLSMGNFRDEGRFEALGAIEEGTAMVAEATLVMMLRSLS